MVGWSKEQLFLFVWHKGNLSLIVFDNFSFYFDISSSTQCLDSNTLSRKDSGVTQRCLLWSMAGVGLQSSYHIKQHEILKDQKVLVKIFATCAETDHQLGNTPGPALIVRTQTFLVSPPLSELSPPLRKPKAHFVKSPLKRNMDHRLYELIITPA